MARPIRNTPILTGSDATKEMSLKHRNEWMILDHQYFTFEHMTRIYSILDIMNVTKPAA